MTDKILGIVCLGFAAASQAWISHDDTALFFTALFLAVGGYELVLGDIRQRMTKG